MGYVQRETDRKVVIGMLCVVAGGVLLSFVQQDGNLGTGNIFGSLYISCLFLLGHLQ